MWAALALDARLLNGMNVWVKPLKFHFALSVYLLTLAWFTRYASPEVTSRPWWRRHERAVVFAVIAEALWIGAPPPWARARTSTNPPPYCRCFTA
jgi:hypothetical protein